MIQSNIVLSVAAGISSEYVRSTGIYACPDDERYSYRKTPFLTVRRPGGHMDIVYQIKSIERINPSEPLLLDHLEDSVRDRIRKYIEIRKRCMGFETPGFYRFYVLSPYRELTHSPAPPCNTPGQRYYNLEDLLRGEKLVHVASKKK